MSKDAPGHLAVIQDFVNTLDVETGEDAIATPAGLEDWLDSRHLLAAADAGCCAADRAVETAVGMREALRTLALANNGDAVDADARRFFVDASANLHLHLRARFGLDQPLLLEADEPGVEGALGTLLTYVFEAMLDGTWPRLKACASDTCRWAFYDHSKNHSGRWCSMAVCGNRTKVRSYRERQAPALSAS
jgi:predicted RNA-binding Zn ribbon-like protein